MGEIYTRRKSSGAGNDGVGTAVETAHICSCRRAISVIPVRNI